jgi:glycosyltransferase involved in cell wall biosynthesis
MSSGAFAVFWRELSERVRAEAHRRGTSPQAELHQFVMQRMLARAFAAKPDAWLLKGSQGLLARFPDARAANDLDLVGIAGGGRARMVADLNEALELDLGDFLTFEPTYDRSVFHGEGAQVGHIARCGDHELMEVKTDLIPAASRTDWREPEMIRFQRLIMPTGARDENPPMRAMSLQDTMAQKVMGMYTQRQRYEDTKCEQCLPRSRSAWVCRNGEQPYRVRDFTDFVFLAANAEWDAAEMHAILHAEQEREKDNLRLSVPRRFAVPNPSWVVQFRKYAAATPGLPFKEIDQATPIAREFLDPLLGEHRPSGRWKPGTGHWIGLTRSSGEPERQRILVVANASGRDQALGGLPVLSGDLTTALAGLDNTDVTLLTVGPAQPHGDAKVVAVEPVDEVSSRRRLLEVASTGWPEQFEGLPRQGLDAFDVVIGHGRGSGEAAALIRQRWYPHAKFAYFLHIAAERYAEARGDPGRGVASAAEDRAVMERADLVVGVGPLLTETAREMSAGADRQPSLHELIPGPGADRSPLRPPLRPQFRPETGEALRILFTAHRVNDPIKGYADLLAAVKTLTDEGSPVELRVRGLPAEEVTAEQQRADTAVGTPGVVEVLPHETDDSVLDADRRWAHVAVMPSRVEGYGLVGSESAERGLPILVTEESGLGQFLRDETRVPAQLGRPGVVRDRGLEGEARVAAWCAAFRDLAADYERRAEKATQLRDVFQAYSSRDAAVAFVSAAQSATRSAAPSAAQSAATGASRHTVQGPRGVIRTLGVEPAAASDAGPPLDRDFVERFTQQLPPVRGRSADAAAPDAQGARPPHHNVVRLPPRDPDRTPD